MANKRIKRIIHVIFTSFDIRTDCPKDSFNRTIVELKCLNRNIQDWVCLTFNRTIVELKFGKMTDEGASDFAFNRTIVELK